MNSYICLLLLLIISYLLFFNGHKYENFEETNYSNESLQNIASMVNDQHLRINKATFSYLPTIGSDPYTPKGLYRGVSDAVMTTCGGNNPRAICPDGTVMCGIEVLNNNCAEWSNTNKNISFRALCCKPGNDVADNFNWTSSMLDSLKYK